MAISERKRARITGRRSGGQFLSLPSHMTGSEAWGNLSGNTTKLIIELARQFTGKNNGDLSAPWSKLQRRGWKSKATLSESIHEALDAGFIKVTRLGGRHRICSLYAITWRPVDECTGKHDHVVENVASNLWQKTEIAVAMRTSAVAMRTSEPEKAKKAA